MRQWTVLPHKNVEIIGWVSLAQERQSGEAAALKRSGRDLGKKCSLLFPKNKVLARSLRRFRLGVPGFGVKGFGFRLHRGLGSFRLGGVPGLLAR